MPSTIAIEPQTIPPRAVFHSTQSRPSTDRAQTLWPPRVDPGTSTRGLTSQEERALIRSAQTGDDRARSRLVSVNTRLIYSIARRYHCRSLTLDDLVQEGTIGLLVAIDRFDAGMGCRLSTYASHWIRQAIARAIEHKDRLIRVPVQFSSELRHVEQARDSMRQRLQREPTLEEVASECTLPPERVSQLIRAGEPVSLDAMLGPDQEMQLGEFAVDESAADPAEGMLADAHMHVVRGMLDRLDERERRVIELRYGLTGQSPKTLQELSELLRISREGVRRIEVRTLARLRHALKSQQWED